MSLTHSISRRQANARIVGVSQPNAEAMLTLQWLDNVAYDVHYFLSDSYIGRANSLPENIVDTFTSYTLLCRSTVTT